MILKRIDKGVLDMKRRLKECSKSLTEIYVGVSKKIERKYVYISSIILKLDKCSFHDFVDYVFLSLLIFFHEKTNGLKRILYPSRLFY